MLYFIYPRFAKRVVKHNKKNYLGLKFATRSRPVGMSVRHKKNAHRMKKVKDKDLCVSRPGTFLYRDERAKELAKLATEYIDGSISYQTQLKAVLRQSSTKERYANKLVHGVLGSRPICGQPMELDANLADTSLSSAVRYSIKTDDRQSGAVPETLTGKKAHPGIYSRLPESYQSAAPGKLEFFEKSIFVSHAFNTL